MASAMRFPVKPCLNNADETKQNVKSSVDLLRLHNEANYTTMCKRTNEAIQIQIPHARVG
jgi:hypothetical protein